MSFKADIPTLSANEVYTLTFEYEGEETIQLTVGDLTLETTDRRVVFTTTSPVNYIESNVNLTNLNMYEGYYESDDLGGEYTQESYIEGKSLINLKDEKSYHLANNWYVLAEMTEDGYKRVTQKSGANGTCCFNSTGDSNVFAKTLTGEKYTVILHVRENTFPSDLTFRFSMFYALDGHYDKNKVDADLVEDENEIGVKKIRGGQTGRAEVVMYNTTVHSTQLPMAYWGILKSVKADDGTDCTNSFGERTDFDGCVLEYTVTVVEGDYYGQEIQPFTGIGCVKLPKILSETKHKNIMINTKPSVTTNLITVSDDNTYIYLAETGRYMELNFKFTQEYLAQYGISNGDRLCIELDGRLIEGTGTQATNTSTRIGITACTWPDGAQGYKSIPENGHYCNYITIVNNASTISISFLNNTDWTETNKIYEIQNLRVYKIEDISEMGTYDCCKITTPDDLELYGLPDGTCDTLDLITGVVTRNTEFYKYTGTWGDANECTVDGYNDGNWWLTRISANPVANKDSVILLHGIVFYQFNGITGQTHLLVPKSLVANSSDVITWLRNNIFALVKKQTPTTEQISINPLKSYHNGSITTSSQQLAPTLKTTLPISNKFTTTNLTSGSTYNVYFDGTATKLDAGGTIITNPISPCEVECGGITLTIEGTDIQNVRVIETTVKNEVGNNGTSDVELSSIENLDVNGENIIISKLEQPIKLRSLGTTYDSYNPVTGELTKRIGVSETDGSYSVLSSPIVMETRKIEVNGYMADKNTICKEYSKGYEFNANGQLSAIDIGHYTDYYIKIPENTKTLSFKGMSYYKRIIIYDENKNFIKCYYTYDNYGDATGNITSDMKYVRLTTVNQGAEGKGYGDMRSYLVTDTNYLVFTSDTSLQTLTIPQLYTNGQVKVYSESEVYPTTILNGQSINNYEINELNTSNNYTIRYDGECESINLANKTNEQGTNRIVKSGATSGNLTFINNSGDIDNVLLVQNDVREQEINHFIGLETVEISGMLLETSQNMWWNDWIEPSQHDANWLVDSADYIQVKGGEIIYIVANSNTYYSIVEFDENYTRIKFSNTLIANPQQQSVMKNGYYKNFLKLGDNTKYIKFVAPKSSAQNQISNPTFTFSKVEFDEPILSVNIPYQCTYIDLPQPVQLNSLPDGTCDTYSPITGEYVQNVGYTDLTNYDTYYQLVNPTITQLTPITIPTFEGGIVQLITTNGKVFPMIEYSMSTNNRYDTSSWETGVVYTQRNMTEAYFNDSTTPMTPTETMTLTTDHISSGSIILNNNGNGLIVLKGNYAERDIPYFTGMRSAEAIEVETTSSDQPLFGKGGRK